VVRQLGRGVTSPKRRSAWACIKTVPNNLLERFLWKEMDQAEVKRKRGCFFFPPGFHDNKYWKKLACLTLPEIMKMIDTFGWGEYDLEK